MKQLVAEKNIVGLKSEMLTDYRQKYGAYHLFQDQADRRIAQSLKTEEPGVEALAIFLQEMKIGGDASEFAKDVGARQRDRLRARKILKEITDKTSLSRSDFLTFYDELAGKLWHSGGLQRSKTKIAKTPKRFRDLVQAAASSTDELPANTFEKLRAIAADISGVGPNVLTEILHTYDDDQFAVMNQNSVSGMMDATGQIFPDRPNKTNTSGALYATFCKEAKFLRRKLNLKNLTELDALLNYAYWR
jgi:hypothetical protein